MGLYVSPPSALASKNWCCTCGQELWSRKLTWSRPKGELSCRDWKGTDVEKSPALTIGHLLPVKIYDFARGLQMDERRHYCSFVKCLVSITGLMSGWPTGQVPGAGAGKEPLSCTRGGSWCCSDTPALLLVFWGLLQSMTMCLSLLRINYTCFLTIRIIAQGSYCCQQALWCPPAFGRMLPPCWQALYRDGWYWVLYQWDVVHTGSSKWDVRSSSCPGMGATCSCSSLQTVSITNSSLLSSHIKDVAPNLLFNAICITWKRF